MAGAKASLKSLGSTSPVSVKVKSWDSGLPSTRVISPVSGSPNSLRNFSIESVSNSAGSLTSVA